MLGDSIRVSYVTLSTKAINLIDPLFPGLNFSLTGLDGVVRLLLARSSFVDLLFYIEPRTNEARDFRTSSSEPTEVRYVDAGVRPWGYMGHIRSLREWTGPTASEAGIPPGW